MNFLLQGYNRCFNYLHFGNFFAYTFIDAETIYKVGQENGTLIQRIKLKYRIASLYMACNYSGNMEVLCFGHYSYIGLDPRGLSDKYVKTISLLMLFPVDYKMLLENHKVEGFGKKTTGTYCWLYK